MGFLLTTLQFQEEENRRQRNPHYGFICLFIFGLHFQIIEDSHAVVGNKAERSQVPFTQFPPMVTSAETIVKYLWCSSPVIQQGLQFG
jgi:hypothetical protein